MQSWPFLEIVIAESEKVFTQLFNQSASTLGFLTKAFLTKADEERYEKKDARLTKRIRAVGNALYDHKFRAQHLHVQDDWWPNHMRYVDTTATALQQPYFDALRNLLVGDYCEWSLQVVVHTQLNGEGNMIGSVVIWHDKLLIDRKLYELLKRQLSLRCKMRPTIVRTLKEARQE